ncbi:MAG TPA: phospholipase D-like domain-containing protein [Anaerolineaceae bacterium]|nr:phospholipase D-like domain-containing protein [Anaerolineaceae bacterium]
MPRRRSSRNRAAASGAVLIIVFILAAAALFERLGFGGRTIEIPTLVGLPTGGIINLTPQAAATATSGGLYSLYFTEPGQPQGTGPDQPLVAAIDQATQSVDVAAYSLSLTSLRDALLKAQQRGVPVRVVMESDNLDGSVPQTLEDAGIPILGDRREGLMHDKFVVIDGAQVWTGSMNLTTSGAYNDNNNWMQIRSPQVAQDYTVEFEEMFTADQFGPAGVANTPYPQVTLDGAQLEVYFSPDDGVAQHVIDLIDGATQSIYFLAYSFTSDPIADAMLQRAQAGVMVGGVFEEAQYESNTGTEYDRLKAAGIDVRLDGNPGQMHHKVIIVDERAVAFGSYNFSASAEQRNDENLLIVHDPTIAARFMDEYRKVYGQAQ